MTREEAIDRIREHMVIHKLNEPRAVKITEALNMAIEALKAEQPKHGHWIIDEYEYLDCSCCGESYYTGCDSTKEAKHRLETGDVYKFCPYCGARMDGEQET